VYATNQDLIELMKQGDFRRDLYYRINTIIIEIPPLRERPGDVELLLRHFLDTFSTGRPRPRLSPAAHEALLNYYWPGNVRELKNLVERCSILYSGRAVDLQVVRAGMVWPEGDSDADALSPEMEKHRIQRALTKTGGNQTKAAELLGMSLSTLRRRTKKYGLS
jgi:transcriptional regulator with PAS, ATPase and Fis domain